MENAEPMFEDDDRPVDAGNNSTLVAVEGPGVFDPVLHRNRTLDELYIDLRHLKGKTYAYGIWGLRTRFWAENMELIFFLPVKLYSKSGMMITELHTSD